MSPDQHPATAHRPSDGGVLEPEELLGLRLTEDPSTWTAEISPGICTGGDFVYGGCGIGLGMVPLERLTGRPPVWVAAQFLSYVGPGAAVEIQLTEAVRGHQLSQARAVVVTGDREVLAVQASLGRRGGPDRGRWVGPPEVPAPESCEPADRWFARPDTVAERMEVLDATAAGGEDPTSTGRVALWARVPELGEATSPLTLALLADTMMMGVSRVLGRQLAGNSLDNTLRVVDLLPTDWVLVEHRTEAVGDGFASATTLLWTREGELLCVASQTARLRELTPEMLRTG